ncbi:MAG: diacylglycerol kinase family protein [Candidatus Sulfotelmatobacter sp.]
MGCSSKDLKPFQSDGKVEWQMGMPSSGDEVEAIVLFGGDGTVHRHLGQLVKLGLPVLVVPAGSGNDFARSLGLGSAPDSKAAWKQFCDGAGVARAIDLGTISDTGATQHYFCCVAGVGLDAEVARRSNKLPRWLRGHGGYALSLAPTIFRFAPFPMKVLATNGNPSGDWDVRSDQPTMLAAFANGPLYGGGMKIAPRAKMDDGLLDVCIVGAVDPFKLFCLFPTVYSGRHLKVREVQYFQSTAVRVETEHPLDVYADGEFVCRTPVEISVQRAALRVIAP